MRSFTEPEYTRGIFVANKPALGTRIICRLLLTHPAIVWWVRHVAWMTRYITGRDGCSLFRRIFDKPLDKQLEEA